MLNSLIIDDESASIKVLTNYIRQVPFLNLVGTATNPVEGLRLIQEQKIDLIFLDIQMPEITGLELIKMIKGRSKVIFVSAYSEFAIEGFDLDVIDYLLKPVPLARFLKAVDKAKNIFNSENGQKRNITEDFIIVKGDSKGKFTKVDTRDIDFIEGAGNYVILHCGQKKILSIISMKELEDKLPHDRFIRVHKSFIVSIPQIASVEGTVITLKNHPGKKNILIGKMYKKTIMDLLKQRLIG